MPIQSPGHRSPAPSQILYQFQSEGVSSRISDRQQQSSNGTRLSLLATHANYANSDTSGASSSLQTFDLQQDYGRASFDLPTVFAGGSIGLPYDIRFEPFMIASPARFQYTTGQDCTEILVQTLVLR